MKIQTLLGAILLSLSASGALAQSTSALDNPNTMTTVMQFTARDKASIPELKNRMAAIRDFVGKQPACIDNVLMQNVNVTGSPSFVGVSRWKSVKDWEALWLSSEFQKLVGSVSDLGTVNPGMFSPVK